jgi:hypothetical protein
MKLITEMTEDVEFLTEKEENGEKHYFINGVFMQAEQKNRNGRVYPSSILMNEVKRYNSEYVNKNRALGELNHPQGPTVNLDRVSHMIKELNSSGNDVVGKAKIMNTPMGKIVQNLMTEGAKLGVSSRGMGSLKLNTEGINEVQKDFLLSAIDIVADPSAPGAFVEGIMEGKEWIWDNGILKEKTINEYCQLIRKSNRVNLEERCLDAFKDFLSKI